MSHNYEQMVRDAVHVGESYELSEEDVIQLLLRTAPLIFNGHFELLSKLHSNIFFRFNSIAQYPAEMAKISGEMVRWIETAELGPIDVVLSTSRAGMFFAYDIARALNDKWKTRAVYAKSDPNSGSPAPSLMDGFSIQSQERVLIVNDLITTGKGVKTLIKLAKRFNSEITGICVFAVRNSIRSDLESIKAGHKFHSIIELKVEDWPKDKCYLCNDNEPWIKSADINSSMSEKSIPEILEELPNVVMQLPMTTATWAGKGVTHHT